MAPATRSGRKIAAAIGREVDEACSIRTRQGTLAVGIGAGLGAAAGAVLGGAVAAGIGGGVGAALGIASAMALAGRLSPPLAWQMALVLTSEGFELHSLSWRGQPDELLFSSGYADVEAVTVAPKWLTVRARIALGARGTIDLEATKAGPESGVRTLETLRSRVDSGRTAPGSR